MSTLPTVVIAGVPNLAAAIHETGLFPNVLEASSSAALRKLVTGPQLKGVRPDRLVFFVGDAIVEDDPGLPLGEFLRKVTNAGYQVVIVAVTANGDDLQRQNPRARLLTLPLRMNSVLYALGNFGYEVEPLANGNVDIPVHGGPRSFGSDAPASYAPSRDARPASMPADRTPDASPPLGGWHRPGPDEIAPLLQNAPAPQPSAQPSPQSPPPTSPPAPTQAAPSMFGQSAPSNPQSIGGWEPTPGQSPHYDGGPKAGAGWTPPSGRRSLADLARESQGGGSQSPNTGQNGWGQGGYQQPTPESPQSPTYGNGPAGGPGPGGPVPNGARLGMTGGPAIRSGSMPTAARPGRRGYVTTISVSKGGTGKSSMTLNLAAFLGMRLRSQGKTVCVIDANTQQSDSGKYLDVYTPNINTIVNDPSLLTEDRVLSALVHKPEYNLSVLLGPPTPDEANPLAISARLYSEVLELLKKHFDYIFIDTPVAEKFHEMFSDFALPRADYIIVPVAPNFTTLHNADNWLRAAVTAPRHEGGAGIDRNRIGVVLNRAEDGIGCSESDVRATMAAWHFIGVIPETKEWKSANNANELVAPKNFANLSHAFAEVLHAATREPALLENFATLEADRPRKGLLGRLRGR